MDFDVHSPALAREGFEANVGQYSQTFFHPKDVSCQIQRDDKQLVPAEITCNPIESSVYINIILEKLHRCVIAMN
ncbi:hypothetical protein L195_g037810 [Trifolium pratense]|uniref:Uncharacterized protein n=1 Tax=Trifolium pratense TaxID=57577 RepID=A0A2K3LTC1_TRIPR|nr:hypothetical protein L195_g037810 [Trifolium pratense]